MKFVCVFIALIGVCSANSIGASRPKRNNCNHSLVQMCANNIGSGGGYPGYPGGGYPGRPDYNNRRWMGCCYRICGSACLDD